MSRRVHISEGLFFGVDRDGYVVNGCANGAKLYIYPGAAAERTGPDGSIYRVRHDGRTVTVERFCGPPLSTPQKKEQT